MEGERHWEHNYDLLDSCSSLPVGSTLPLGRHQGWDAACLRLSRLILDSWDKPDGFVGPSPGRWEEQAPDGEENPIETRG